eukprot:COSAG03_NODE_1773_length_3540_cov_16.784946_6_plen_71_part_00
MIATRRPYSGAAGAEGPEGEGDAYAAHTEREREREREGESGKEGGRERGRVRLGGPSFHRDSRPPSRKYL